MVRMAAVSLLVFVFFLKTVSVAHADITSNLVAWWKFDEGSGTTVADSTGNGHTGTLNGTAAFTSSSKIGPFAALYSTGGSNDGTTFASITTGTTFTYSAWIFPTGDSTGVYQNLMTQGSNLGIWLHNGKIDYFSSNADHVSNTTITLNTWHFVSVVFSAGSATFYLDGVADGTVSPVSAMSPNGMGCDPGATECFPGRQDDVRFYSRALSSSDIAQLYLYSGQSSWVVKTQPVSSALAGNLVGWWTFDGKDTLWTSSSAGTTKDKSGNNNTGTLNGMSLSTAPTPGKVGQALSFNGSSSYVNVSDSSSLDPSDLTIAVWVKFNVVNGSFQTIAAKWQVGVKQQYVLQLNSTNKIGFWTAGGGSGGATDLESNATMVAGRWYYIVATIAGTSKALYIDGNLDTSGTGSAVGSSNIEFTIGGKKDGSGTYFEFLNGIIDNLQLYSRGLSATEVQQSYSASPAKVRAASLAPCVTSYANHGGTGDRRPSFGLANILVTSSGSGITAMQGGGGASDSAWVDGDTTSAGHGFFGSVALNGTQWLEFDFNTGNTVLITEAKYYQGDSTPQGTWKWQGSNDNSSWTDVGGSFALGGVPTETITTLSGNLTKYRYYRMLGLSGSTDPTPWLFEMEFKICGLP